MQLSNATNQTSSLGYYGSQAPVLRAGFNPLCAIPNPELTIWPFHQTPSNLHLAGPLPYPSHHSLPQSSPYLLSPLLSDARTSNSTTNSYHAVQLDTQFSTARFLFIFFIFDKQLFQTSASFKSLNHSPYSPKRWFISKLIKVKEIYIEFSPFYLKPNILPLFFFSASLGKYVQTDFHAHFPSTCYKPNISPGMHLAKSTVSVI